MLVNFCNKTQDAITDQIIGLYDALGSDVLTKMKRAYDLETIGSKNAEGIWCELEQLYYFIGQVFAVYEQKQLDKEGGTCTDNSSYLSDWLDCIIEKVECDGYNTEPLLEIFKLFPGTGINYMEIEGTCLPFTVY